MIVRVVARPSVASGFALAGLPGLTAANGAEAAARVGELRARADVGVVLVEEELYDDLPEETRRRSVRDPVPMIIPFPGPAWIERPAPEAYLVELLRQAIGYRVRLR